jgi:hypothetical protein
MGLKVTLLEGQIVVLERAFTDRQLIKILQNVASSTRSTSPRLFQNIVY